MDYVMALDAGTGSIRAAVFDRGGRQCGVAAREWKHREDPRWPGSMDFDWEGGWALACACIREVLERTGVRAEEVAAVSATCMREGIVLYDRGGREIWACANVDARADAEVEELKRMDPGLERELYMKSGQCFALGALPRLLWVKNHLGDVYAKAARMGMFNDWLLCRLSDDGGTGFLAVEPSNGSTTGLFGLKTRAWDREIARLCGLRDDIFPDVVECGVPASRVSARGAAETGLREGTPLVVGAGDCQAASIGSGLVGDGQAAIFGGSFWQYEFNTAKPVMPSGCELRVNCHALPGLWQYEALAFKPGLVMRWFRDAFCREEIRSAGDRDPYALLDGEAAKIPAGSYGMMAAFSNVMHYSDWRHAAPSFINFDLDAEKFNKYTFYRAIMENTALVTLGHLLLVERVTGKKPERVVFAGGAAKSSLWAQIVADVLGVPVSVPEVKEAACLGAAFLAFQGIGLSPDVREAARLVRMEAEYLPDPENHARYGEAFVRWRKMYDAQLALSDTGVTRHLWKAPGVKTARGGRQPSR